LNCDVFIKFNRHEYLEKKNHSGVAKEESFNITGRKPSQEATLLFVFLAGYQGPCGSNGMEGVTRLAISALGLFSPCLCQPLPQKRQNEDSHFFRQGKKCRNHRKESR
jgi:hypothetical protein